MLNIIQGYILLILAGTVGGLCVFAMLLTAMLADPPITANREQMKRQLRRNGSR